MSGACAADAADVVDAARRRGGETRRDGPPLCCWHSLHRGSDCPGAASEAGWLPRLPGGGGTRGGGGGCRPVRADSENIRNIVMMFWWFNAV